MMRKKTMTSTVTIFDIAMTRKIAARGRKRTGALVFVSALLTCLGSPMLSSSAAAAPFQQFEMGLCSETGCLIPFAVTPTGKRLEVYNVSCYLRMSGALDLFRVGLTVNADAHQVVLTPERVAGSGASGRTVYQATNSIFAFAREGEQFAAFVEWNKGDVDHFECHISGEMLDAPA
jgi:hypothetical protein